MTDYQPSLFDDGTEGTRRKEAGQSLAEAAAAEWTDRAVRAIRDIVREQGEVNADDLVARVGLPRDVATNRNNAVGAAFSVAAKEHIIRPTTRTVKSRRRTNNSRRIMVWERW